MGGTQSGPFTKYPTSKEDRLLPILQTYAFSGNTQGKRDAMEDRDVIGVLNETYFPYIQYFAIFDGHGGSTVSQYASKQLGKHITQHMLLACRQMEAVFGHADRSYQLMIQDAHTRSKTKEPGLLSCGKNVDYVQDAGVHDRYYDNLYDNPSSSSKLPWEEAEPQIGPHGKREILRPLEHAPTISPPIPENSQSGQDNLAPLPGHIDNCDDPEQRPPSRSDSDENNNDQNDQNNDEYSANGHDDGQKEGYGDQLYPKRTIRLPTLETQRGNDARKLPPPIQNIYATKQTTISDIHLLKSAQILHKHRSIPPYLHKCLYWHTRYDILRTQSIHNAVVEAFMSFDNDLLNRYANSSLTSGSTALVVLLDTLHGTIFTANVGDSRAILGRNGTAVPLSQIHAPMLPIERERIKDQGLSVMMNRVNGSLAISRALGDAHLKANLVAAPSHVHTPLLERDPNIAQSPGGANSGNVAGLSPPNSPQNARSPHAGQGIGVKRRSEREQMSNLLGLKAPFHNCKPYKNACSSVPFTLSQSVSSLAKDHFVILGCDGLFDCLSEQTIVDWVYARFRHVAVRALCNAHVYAYTPSTARFLDAMVRGRVGNFQEYRERFLASNHTPTTYPHIEQSAQLEQRYEWALTQPQNQNMLLGGYTGNFGSNGTVGSQGYGLVVNQPNSPKNNSKSNDNGNKNDQNNNNLDQLVSPLLNIPSLSQQPSPSNPIQPGSITTTAELLQKLQQLSTNPQFNQVLHHARNAVPKDSSNTTYTKPIDLPWHILGMYNPIDHRDPQKDRAISLLNFKQQALMHQEAHQQQYGVRIWGQTGAHGHQQHHTSKPRRRSDNMEEETKGRSGSIANSGPKSPQIGSNQGGNSGAGGGSASGANNRAAKLQQQGKEANYGVNAADFYENQHSHVLNAAKSCIMCGQDLLRNNRSTQLLDKQRQLRRQAEEYQSSQIHVLYSASQSLFNKAQKPTYGNFMMDSLSLSGSVRKFAFPRNSSTSTQKTQDDDSSSFYGYANQADNVLGVRLLQLFEPKPLYEQVGENPNGNAASLIDYFEKITMAKIRSDPGFVCPYCDYLNGLPLLPASTPMDHISAYVLPQYDLDINANEDVIAGQQKILLSDARFLSVLPKHRSEKDQDIHKRNESLQILQGHSPNLAPLPFPENKDGKGGNIDGKNNVSSLPDPLLLPAPIQLTTSDQNDSNPNSLSPNNQNQWNNIDLIIIPNNSSEQTEKSNQSHEKEINNQNNPNNQNNSNTQNLRPKKLLTNNSQPTIITQVTATNDTTSTTNLAPFQLSSFPPIPPSDLYQYLKQDSRQKPTKIPLSRYLPIFSTINNNKNFKILSENNKRIVKIPYFIHNINVRTRSVNYPLRPVPQRHLYTNDPISSSLSLQEQLLQRYIRYIKHHTITKNLTSLPAAKSVAQRNAITGPRTGRFQRLPSGVLTPHLGTGGSVDKGHNGHRSIYSNGADNDLLNNVNAFAQFQQFCNLVLFQLGQADVVAVKSQLICSGDLEADNSGQNFQALAQNSQSFQNTGQTNQFLESAPQLAPQLLPNRSNETNLSSDMNDLSLLLDQSQTDNHVMTNNFIFSQNFNHNNYPKEDLNNSIILNNSKQSQTVNSDDVFFIPNFETSKNSSQQLLLLTKPSASSWDQLVINPMKLDMDSKYHPQSFNDSFIAFCVYKFALNNTPKLSPKLYPLLAQYSSQLLQSTLFVLLQGALFSHDFITNTRNSHFLPLITQSSTPISTLTTSSTLPSYLKYLLERFNIYNNEKDDSSNPPSKLTFSTDSTKSQTALLSSGLFHGLQTTYAFNTRNFPLVSYSNYAQGNALDKKSRSALNNNITPSPNGGRVFTFGNQPLGGNVSAQNDDFNQAIETRRQSQISFDESSMDLSGIDQDGSKSGTIDENSSQKSFVPIPLGQQLSNSGQHAPIILHPNEGNIPSRRIADDCDLPKITPGLGNIGGKVAEKLADKWALSTPLKPTTPSPSLGKLAPIHPITSASPNNVGGYPKVGTEGKNENDFSHLLGGKYQTHYADCNFSQRKNEENEGNDKNDKKELAIYGIIGLYPYQLSRCPNNYLPPRSDGRNITSPDNETNNEQFHFVDSVELINVQKNLKVVLSADILHKNNSTLQFEQIFIISNVDELTQSTNHQHIFFIPFLPILNQINDNSDLIFNEIVNLFNQHDQRNQHNQNNNINKNDLKNQFFTQISNFLSNQPIFIELGLSPKIPPEFLSNPPARPPQSIQRFLYHTTFPLVQQTIVDFSQQLARPSPTPTPTPLTSNPPPTRFIDTQIVGGGVNAKYPSILTGLLETCSQQGLNNSNANYNNNNNPNQNFNLSKYDRFIEKFRSHQHIWLSFYISHLFQQQSQQQHFSCFQNLVTTVTTLELCQRPTPRPLPDVVDTIGYTTELDLASYCMFKQAFHPTHHTNQNEESRRTTKQHIVTENPSLDDPENQTRSRQGSDASNISTGSNGSTDADGVGKQQQQQHGGMVRIVDDDDPAGNLYANGSFSKKSNIHRLPGAQNHGGNGMNPGNNGANTHTNKQQWLIERERQEFEQEMMYNKRDLKAHRNQFGNSLHNICFELIERALAAGSKDNISTVILFFRFPLVEDVIYSLEHDTGQIDEHWDTSRRYLQYSDNDFNRDDDDDDDDHDGQSRINFNNQSHDEDGVDLNLNVAL